MLLQNYPNPFNPSTSIKFGLPIESIVKLEVYNIFGERVGQLLNEVRSSGYHRVKWSTIGLATGVYFYSINVKSLEGGKDFRDVKKMV